jgi:SAM-dependent methyltransferase
VEPIEYEKMAACEATMWWYRALHDRVIERASAAPHGAALLDAGCGTGGCLARIAAARPDLRLHGLEYDAGAARTARGKAHAAIAIGSVHAMPYPEDAFDVIVSADVLCHARVDPRAALAEFCRCLKPGGLMLLNLPAFAWLLSAHDRDVHNVRRFTRRESRRAVVAAGFADVAAGYWNGLLFPLVAAHRLVAPAAATSDVRPYPEWQDRLLFGVTDLERRAARSGLRLPFGSSVWVRARKP